MLCMLSAGSFGLTFVEPFCSRILGLGHLSTKSNKTAWSDSPCIQTSRKIITVLFSVLKTWPSKGLTWLWITTYHTSRRGTSKAFTESKSFSTFLGERRNRNALRPQRSSRSRPSHGIDLLLQSRGLEAENCWNHWRFCWKTHMKHIITYLGYISISYILMFMR